MSGHSSAHHATCQNCQAPLTGPYCSACGQHDVDYHRSLWPVLEDALEGFFHFDGKAVKSVRYLLTRPGFLTQEFVAGRRASYANPLRLYIFISFLFFLAQALLGHRMTQAEQAQIDRELTESKEQAAEAVRNTPQAQKAIQAANARRASGESQPAGAPAAAPAPTPTPSPEAAGRLLPLKVNVSKAPPDFGEAVAFSFSPDSDNKSAVSRYIRQHLGPDGKVDSRAVQAEFEHLAPAMLFLCLPVLALILTVAYKGTHRFYVEHLVFALHVQAFIFLSGLIAFVGAKILVLASSGAAVLLQVLIFLAATWLVYRAFRRFYGQGRAKTLLKLALVSGSYAIVLILGTVAIAISSVMVVVREA